MRWIVIQVQYRRHVPERVTFDLRKHERREHRCVDPRTIREVPAFAPEHAEVELHILSDNERVVCEERFHDRQRFLERRLIDEIIRTNARENLYCLRDLAFLTKLEQLFVFLFHLSAVHDNARIFHDTVNARNEPGRFGIQDEEGNLRKLHADTIHRIHAEVETCAHRTSLRCLRHYAAFFSSATGSSFVFFSSSVGVSLSITTWTSSPFSSASLALNAGSSS